MTFYRMLIEHIKWEAGFMTITLHTVPINKGPHELQVKNTGMTNRNVTTILVNNKAKQVIKFLKILSG